jgi:acetate kinase
MRICDGLGFLGLELDPHRNDANSPVISTDASRVAVRVIRTDEELMIARSVSSLLAGPSHETRPAQASRPRVHRR